MPTELKHIDLAAINSQPSARLAFMQEFIGFTAEDQAALAESVEVVAPHLPALLDGIYDHLLSYDDTRRLFLGDKGEVDPRYMAIRKEHLTEWVLQTVGAKDGSGFASFLTQTASRHTAKGGEAHRVVPPRYMVGLTGFLQGLIWNALFTVLPGEPDRVRRYGLAWNRMLMVQLETFLKVMAPGWPKWDEGQAA